jgi:hypothetical protein
VTCAQRGLGHAKEVEYPEATRSSDEVATADVGANMSVKAMLSAEPELLGELAIDLKRSANRLHAHAAQCRHGLQRTCTRYVGADAQVGTDSS